MEVIIHPYQGIDDSLLDAGVDDVRRSIGGEFRRYKKGVTDADQFLGKYIHAYYDSNGRCKAFEIYRPTEAVLFGFRITGSPFIEVFDWLRSKTNDVELINSGARSLALGIALFVPNDDLVEGVLVFRKGYWDKKKPD